MKATRELFRQPTMLLLSAALVASIGSARAQVASNAPPAPAAAATAPKVASSDQEVVELSPFEVNATKDSGYYTANTLAGTRLNNNIADLPSSITVVTKQQLEDTGSMNINDVFRYEANTEGAHTYTQYVMIRTNLSDATGGGGGTSGNYVSAATTGNRVRGLSNADQEEDNFFSLYRIPFDSYNTSAVEIDRGPNSIIYGSGSPAGIVNQARTQANANKLSGEVSFLGGSWGTYRETFNANVPIIKDRLGIFVAQMFQQQGFQQKPSNDLTRREYGAFVLYPFKNHKTKLSGSFEYFNNYANDPNGLTPVDYVTPWIASGMPTWNPVTDVVSYLSGGKVLGPYALSTTYPNYNPAVGSPYWTPGSGPLLQSQLTTSTSPYFVPGMAFVASHRFMFIDQGNVENAYNYQQTALSNPGWVPTTFTTSQALVNEERLTQSAALPWPSQGAAAGANALQLKYANWNLPGVNSKTIYDWSKININSVNNTQTTSKTYNVNFDQEILSNLHVQVAWFRQELKQLQDSPTSQANATQLFVDTNTNLPNGAINPHLGQPMLDVYQTDVYTEPETNNNWRAMLVYEPDLRKVVPSWLSWLGHHRILGVFTQHDDVITNLRSRPSIDGGDSNYMPTTTAYTAATGYSFAGKNDGPEQFIYLGGATSAGNGYGASSPGIFNRPGFGGANWANITTYNYATGTWGTSPIHMDTLLYATGGLSQNIQDSKTFFWQGFFWKDRIVASMGIDDDQVKSRANLFPSGSNAAAIEFTNGMANTQYWYNYGPWYYIGGNTSTKGVVLHAFKDWDQIDRAADSGNIFAAVLRTLSFTFNKSDNFNPPTAYYTDFFGNALGKPTGTEKDYGVEIATPDNKLFLRATWFKTTNENALYSPTSTGRALYIDNNEFKSWATDVVEIRNGYELPSDPNWNNANVYPITTAMQAQISSLTGLPYNFGGNVGPQGQYMNASGNQNGVAKGVELEATFNPIPNWTMKFSWGKQQTTVSGVSKQAQAWIDYRMPSWLAAAAPDLTTVYPKQGTASKPLYLGSMWNGYGFSDTDINSTSGWTSSQGYYTVVEGAQLATDEANNGQLAPNQREYSWSYLTNYNFDHGPAKNLGIGGAVSYSGQATAGYYADPTKVNPFGVILSPNILQPIYTPAQYHLDAWISYKMQLGTWAGNKISCMVQFNVQDITSSGKLLPVQFNWDGSPAAFRIIAPRSYTITTKFAF
jgi:outer membrane receptor protein involved in Fe transport